MEAEGLYEFGDGDSSISLDTRQFPLLVARWRGTPTLPLVQRYFEAQERVLRALQAKEGRAILLTRTEEARRPPAHVRRFINERTRELRPLNSEIVVAGAIVITSPLVRGAVTVMTWVDPALSVLTLASVSEGYAWARDTLIELDLPPALDRSA